MFINACGSYCLQLDNDGVVGYLLDVELIEL